jgi:hypothetical protein
VTQFRISSGTAERIRLFFRSEGGACPLIATSGLTTIDVFRAGIEEEMLLHF